MAYRFTHTGQNGAHNNNNQMQISHPSTGFSDLNNTTRIQNTQYNSTYTPNVLDTGHSTASASTLVADNPNSTNFVPPSYTPSTVTIHSQYKAYTVIDPTTTTDTTYDDNSLETFRAEQEHHRPSNVAHMGTQFHPNDGNMFTTPHRPTRRRRSRRHNGSGSHGHGHGHGHGRSTNDTGTDHDRVTAWQSQTSRREVPFSEWVGQRKPPSDRA